MPHHSPRETSSWSREKTELIAPHTNLLAALTMHSLRKEERDRFIFRVYYAPGLLLGTFARCHLIPTIPFYR